MVTIITDLKGVLPYCAVLFYLLRLILSNDGTYCPALK